ncbi:unnamed protein product [Gulo gulo]|uniref:Uncharacterized protein n=1 Tax=Gulo gulo TaxID=48420 RepID=A0A9X9LMR7_GULGU|nr:unnamed protein product [Gulo gulo]
MINSLATLGKRPQDSMELEREGRSPSEPGEPSFPGVPPKTAGTCVSYVEVPPA